MLEGHGEPGVGQKIIIMSVAHWHSSLLYGSAVYLQYIVLSLCFGQFNLSLGITIVELEQLRSLEKYL